MEEFLTVDQLNTSLQRFSWPDYTVFFIMLLLSALIGVYFGFFKESKSSTDYLIGGRSMKVFPISLSLIASYISGISLLGTPTEIYLYGTQYVYCVGGLILMGLVMSKAYLPVFHDLKLTSSYEYLAMRFDNKVRLFGSLLFCISVINWLSLVIYVPALAFNQVSGIDVHLITPLVCLVCIFYTSMGGLKAVVWTDVLQTFSMFGAIILVIVKGTLDVGGVAEVFKRNIESGRIEYPEWSLDPTLRHTIWNLVIGGCISFLQSNAVSQTMIQRYLALPTKQEATRAVWYFILGTLSLILLCSYSGLLIFAVYHTCDPLTTKLAKAKDQLLPLLVMDTLGSLPGLPGLFVAGVFSAALSSMSTGLNSMAAVTLEDFYKPFIKPQPTNRESTILMRFVVVVIGIVCVCLVYVVENLGAVLQLAISLSAITNGPSIGLFTMGIFLPFINSTGALYGGLLGLLSMACMIIGTQTVIARGHLTFPLKPVTTSGCNYAFNSTTPVVVIDSMAANVWSLFQVSYMWYTILGCIISILVASIVSIFTQEEKLEKLKLELFSPIIRKYLIQTDTGLICIKMKKTLVSFEIPVISISTTEE
uniref:Sodium-coupled monocarboxylate transporter 1 n=1 Tax=Clastoptera arizonana TaxID=38151 RepID=A0A1B6DZY1_9HEMI